MKAKKHPFMAPCALALLAAAGMVSLNAHAQCNIYMGTNQQVIDGYGFSSAWCGILTTPKNNALYGTLGMSLLRVRFDPGGPGNWGQEITNAMAAHAAGAKVLGTSWSGPGAWTTTMEAMNGFLLPQYYADYANWLSQAAIAHNVDWASPANEPDLGWMAWTSEELTTWIGQYGACIGRPMLAPESFCLNDDYGDPIIDDPKAGPYVSVYGGHLYGGGLSVHTNALALGRHVWMTEYYWDGPNDMSVCVQIAKQINDCMNDQFSAYIWWWDNDSDTNTVLVLSDGTINKNGYTMGQFAKWIRPGSTRVTADYNPSPGVFVTAYNVNGSAVIVAVNTNQTSSVNQQFTIHNANAAALEGYQTSSSQDMADMGSFGGSGGSFTAKLPAQSITTFVQTNGTPADVPPPWTAQDIGSVGVVGSTTYTNSVFTNGVFTVAASGADIWSTTDAFRFVYETNSGNCAILARVSSAQSTNSMAKAGVMIRDSLNPGAANAFIGVTPGNGLVWQYRLSDGGGCSNSLASGLSAPYWVKLVRSASTFTGYYSADGTNWTQLGTTTIGMGSLEYAGLAFCNHGNASLGTATFDNVAAPGWPIPPPSVATGLTATAGVEQVMLNWQAGSYATSNNVERATVSGGPYTTVATVRGTGYIDSDLVGGTTYYYVVQALNGVGQTGNSAQASATPTANVPSPWVAQDIGSVGVTGSQGEAGSESCSNGVFTVAGSGDDIWSTADAFRFVYETNGGNCTIIARVVSLQEPTNVTIDPWSKAGVMVRASLDPGAANAFIAVTPSNGVTWQDRSSTGGGSVNAATSGLSAPYWVKLVRSGNTFTGYRSPDGTNWTQQGTATFTMSSTAYVGLAVTAHNNSSMATATFDNVSAPGWPAPLSSFIYSWGSPVSFGGLNANQILTNFPGTEIAGAMFAQNGGSPITVSPGGGSPIVFAPADTSWASLAGGNGFTTGASTNSTGDADFDSCLNAFYYDGATNTHTITMSGLVVGRQYSVQLFALDDRSLSPAGGARTVNWQNPGDSFYFSATYSMADNAYVVVTFVASNAVQAIQENLLNSGYGNFNCLVLRAVGWNPPPYFIVEPVNAIGYLGNNASLSGSAAGDSTIPDPAIAYQWQAGPNGGPYTNLVAGAKYAGTTNATLTINNLAVSDGVPAYVLVASNGGGSVTSSVANVSVIIQPRNLVGEWLNGAASLADVSGYSTAGIHDGYGVGNSAYTFTNDVPPGAHGQSLWLYGNGSAIAINNTSTNDPAYTNTFDNGISNSLTVTVWARGWPGQWSPWVSKWGESENGAEAGWQLRDDGSDSSGGGGVGYPYACWTVRNDSAGTVTLGTDPNGNPDDMATRSIAIGTGNKTWHFYAGTFDGISGNRDLYIDGVLAASETGNKPYFAATGEHLCIGGKDSPPGNSFGNYFTGEIYDVRVYNYALSQSQVATVGNLVPSFSTCQVVTAVSGVQSPNGAGLVLAWPYGTLLQATNLLGPWSPANATSPYTNNLALPQQFFRLQN
jgi:glucuronoarabinoxylan endo-1,4-beta-xylanase